MVHFQNVKLWRHQHSKLLPRELCGQRQQHPLHVHIPLVSWAWDYNRRKLVWLILDFLIDSQNGTASSNPSTLKATALPESRLSNQLNVRVVDTDYINYAVWHNCVTVNGVSGDRVVVALRSSVNKYSNANVLSKINAAISKIGFDPKQIPNVARSSCYKL